MSVRNRGYRTAPRGQPQARPSVPTYSQDIDEYAEFLRAPLAGREIRPNPDPSVVTQQSIDRSINSLQELLDTRFEGVETRFEALDRATALFETNLTRVPTETQKACDALKAIVMEMFVTVDEKFGTVTERFNTVTREFKLREDYTNQSAIDRKEELKTALSAAEKAVDKQATAFSEATRKSETATGELLRQQGELLRTTKEGLETQISDLKVRLAIAEATAAAARESAATAGATAAAVVAGQRSDHSANQVDRGYSTQMLFNVIMGVVAVAAIAVAVFKP